MSNKSTRRSLPIVRSSSSRTSKVGTVLLNGQYKVLSKIGSGAFGDIYCVEQVHSGIRYAIKIENINSKCLQLPTEYRCYKTLDNEFGFAKCILFERTNTDLLLIMELLGKNLKELFEMCSNKFSLKTVLYVAIQAITRLETLHNKRFVYRDIKPENFMIGPFDTERAQTIHLIDFGLVKEYIDPRTGKHIPMRENKPMTGTARYMSCNAHFNYELSRRDDLESLGYMLLFLLKGSLPWSGVLQHSIDRNAAAQSQRIGSMKQALAPEELFHGFPLEFAEYLSYARGLAFEETPNYTMLRDKFVSVFDKHNLVDDRTFDWNSMKNVTSDSSI